VFPASPSADRRCQDLTACTSLEYQTKAPTATSDRACATTTLCDLDKTYQKQAPTATSNRVCAAVRSACPSGEKETPPTLTSDRECTPVVAANGCAPGIAFASKVNDYLWLCSSGAVGAKGWLGMAKVGCVNNTFMCLSPIYVPEWNYARTCLNHHIVLFPISFPFCRTP